MTKHPALPYLAPFLAFIGMMAVEKSLPLPIEWLYPLRILVTLAVTLIFSRHLISYRPRHLALSVGVGVAVFLIWVGPDVLFHYRSHWLFENSLTGKAATSLPPGLKVNFWFLLFRAGGSTLLVPIIEELFWRAWMMRWLINPDFEKVKLGAYTPMAFWLVAILFASEHGPYWEVGLLAGIAYNWLMLRTKNIGDCTLAHAITNGVLSIYVMAADQWAYWL